ncbi:pentatricopeptide repeat-containing protein [Prunus yedoensis var. nudiflora]|uniref:Pentatricopeptide repeat-containing protein n=1 Tax=Prunus yedoensis var. nudiflora TaxID=2094558 RepID=A0A314ZJC6_PRUYE|nr:pentatricopeptide repeat-containing protein [Prunus yedoensis var. nudiflora]
MHGLCVNGKVDEAFGMLKRMENEGIDPDTITFNILIAGLRKQGRFEEGIKLLEEMRGKGCDPNAGSYQEVLYCFLDAQRFVEAKEFMSWMISKGWPEFCIVQGVDSWAVQRKSGAGCGLGFKADDKTRLSSEDGDVEAHPQKHVSEKSSHFCISYEEIVDN